LSLKSGFEGPLRTASQIAGAWGATVAILHVVTHEEKALKEPCTPLTVSTRLQRFLQQLCDAHCPLEISIRDGDPSEAILKFDALHPHDLILLRCAEDFGVQRPFCGTTRRVLNEAHCPVLLTRPEPERIQTPVDLLISESPARQSMLTRPSGVVQ
jgi:nucleotide-binding universal stress UspA family protein